MEHERPPGHGPVRLSPVCAGVVPRLALVCGTLACLWSAIAFAVS